MRVQLGCQWLKSSYLPVIVTAQKHLQLQGKSWNTAKVLDFGCGYGKITFLLRKYYSANVIGVDSSASMIEEAKKFDPEGQFVLVENDKKEKQLESGSFDVVVSNFVWCTIASAEKMVEVAKDCHRLLKPGCILVVLVENPLSAGVATATFKYGNKNTTYTSGSKIHVQLFNDDKAFMEFEDTFWTREDYKSALNAAGFNDVEMFSPTHMDVDTVQQIKFLQSRGLFPAVPYENYAEEEPTVLLIVAKK